MSNYGFRINEFTNAFGKSFSPPKVDHDVRKLITLQNQSAADPLGIETAMFAVVFANKEMEYRANKNVREKYTVLQITAVIPKALSWFNGNDRRRLSFRANLASPICSRFPRFDSGVRRITFATIYLTVFIA